ncbi:MAG TPA: ABC transporter ATP-binding protein [Micromonosporaceae bacterium]|jgi:oligopeptide/dipeptide ABC transporter ATP-binding protein
MSLVEIEKLSVTYARPVLTGITLTVEPGEILGVIGETGSGKTTLARAIVGLAPVSSGRIVFDGTELTRLRGRSLREFRRTGAIQLMFQDPLRALDPQQTVTTIVAEGLRIAGRTTTGRGDLDDRVGAALDAVGLDQRLGGRTPAQLSGGQRQRVLLARAIAMRPRLLLADEPVSALDASNRNHVLRLLEELRSTTGLAIVIISHDLSSLAGIADRVAVLYGGRIVEQGPIQDVLHRPEHPYTALLAAAAPSVRRPRRRPLRAADLRPDGEPATFEAGCVYAGRCRFATMTCSNEPDLVNRPGDRTVACHHADSWRDLLVKG